MYPANGIHVLVLAHPVQGHINPMLQFSKRLASKGLEVTFLIPISTKKSLNLVNASSIRVEYISDGFDDVEADKLSIDEYLNHLRLSVSRSLSDFIQKHQCCEESPAKVLIYDSFDSWVLDVATEHGMQGASFFTQSCVVSWIYYLVHQGTVKLPLKVVDGQGCVLSDPPVMSALGLNDFPSFVADVDKYPAILKTVLGQFSNFGNAKWLLFNTFTELEEELVNWMGNQWSMMTVGPTIPSVYMDKRLEDDIDYGLSLFKPEAEACLRWLDSKPPRSTVYVSFGSLASLGEDQMAELASGLRSMKSHFLWVVRESEEKKLPSNFMQELGLDDGKKGLMVRWCDQLQVLSHGSVGCFMTHCGWNSTLEALSLGVPMVVMPQWSDQPTNATFIVEVWKVGLRVRANEQGVVIGEEIESCVNEIMDGEKGKEIRENSSRWKEIAKRAVGEGGCSDKNIQEFFSNIVDLCT
ncbi:UDP-glycosyltransferase 74E1-like isoform X3 [Rhodamnia argentea]|uniref:Glycosyltransferase n=1 Tax=Rhodamnia argentea TaxID=178133 RepID=A0A8B8PNU2_9MYRT|nr:UDP-glycosyltransferase 74E1-like isoform X3 [Rhodamnia argentea]